MPFAAALSTRTDIGAALDEVSRQLITDADLAFVFFSPHHAENAAEIASAVRERLRPRTLLGCIGETVVGNDREVENSPALSVWTGKWKTPVEVEPFHIVLERTSEGASLLGWPDGLVGAAPESSAMLVLGDPYSYPTDFFLTKVNNDYRGLHVMGGMASGMAGPGECRLLLDDAVHDHGAIGVLLQGQTGLRPIVSQGCRPIGRHMVVTKAEEDIIVELSGRPPLAILQDLWPTLSPRDQQLFQRGLHIGRVINEFQGEFQRGDFLVRNVRGLDRETGAMAITDRARVGQTVQFHVRDAETADEDLHALLQLDLAAHEKKPAGALLFSCNGRGTRLFDEPNHDARAIRSEAGPVPLAGFFAAGELGPVGGLNFIHGFTASVALFEE